jgi:hypothetical protein
MADTLLLDRDLWDLVVDASGNLAIASDTYSVVQDVASACRTFLGEVYYDTTDGVPYFQSILGKAPSASFIKSQLVIAASSVPGCNNPIVYLTGLVARKLTGQVQFTDSNGQAQVAAF